MGVELNQLPGEDGDARRRRLPVQHLHREPGLVDPAGPVIVTSRWVPERTRALNATRSVAADERRRRGRVGGAVEGAPTSVTGERIA